MFGIARKKGDKVHHAIFSASQLGWAPASSSSSASHRGTSVGGSSSSSSAAKPKGPPKAPPGKKLLFLPDGVVVAVPDPFHQPARPAAGDDEDQGEGSEEQPSSAAGEPPRRRRRDEPHVQPTRRGDRNLALAAAEDAASKKKAMDAFLRDARAESAQKLPIRCGTRGGCVMRSSSERMRTEFVGSQCSLYTRTEDSPWEQW
jgi:hypothetical protein